MFMLRTVFSRIKENTFCKKHSNLICYKLYNIMHMYGFGSHNSKETQIFYRYGKKITIFDIALCNKSRRFATKIASDRCLLVITSFFLLKTRPLSKGALKAVRMVACSWSTLDVSLAAHGC